MFDLALGGAERLVVDAALGLQQLGHSVDIYTSHHDSRHCFEETRDGERKTSFFVLVNCQLTYSCRKPKRSPH